MTSIILIEPSNPGNIGAVARIMKNFGFHNLVLINPRCSHLSPEARNRAKHAQDILKKAKLRKNLNGFDYLIGTTSQLGSDYNLPRTPITPKQLAERIKKIKSDIGIVFGREGEGLHNDEILKCDFIVTIPTTLQYPALNVSHSVAIILYELFQASKSKKVGDQIMPIDNTTKKVLLGYISEVLNKLKFSTKEKKETQKIVWKKIIGKSFLSRREAFALIGFFRKLR